MSETSSHVRPPQTWAMLGVHAGDNAQVLALAKALGWPITVKQIRYDENCPIDYKDRGASLIGVAATKSDPLTPPWPEAIIAIGRRSVPVARWVKAQSDRQILHVHLGRPRADLALFDLVVTTPQYDLPDAANVVKITLPFVSLEAEELAKAAAEWRERFAALPRPWTGVMVGGPTTQLQFGVEEARRLVDELAALLARHDGSLLVTTSPRTKPDTAAALLTGLKEKMPWRHLFTPFGSSDSNPYKAILALSDRFVVSIDSASMVAETVTRQKPVYVFHLPPKLLSRLARNLQRRRKQRQDDGQPADPLDKLYDFWIRRGKATPPRDINLLENRLIELGVVQPLSDAASEPSGTFDPISAETRTALARIQRLWADRAK